VETIASWLARYETAHYRQFNDPHEVEALEHIGLELCHRPVQELPGSKIVYFSAARMETLKSALGRQQPVRQSVIFQSGNLPG
jgi:hypothetical protein